MPNDNIYDFRALKGAHLQLAAVQTPNDLPETIEEGRQINDVACCVGDTCITRVPCRLYAIVAIDKETGNLTWGDNPIHYCIDSDPYPTPPPTDTYYLLDSAGEYLLDSAAEKLEYAHG